MFKAFRSQAGGGTPVAALASPPLITIVDEGWQPQVARPARPFGAVHQGSLRSDLGQLNDTPDLPNASCNIHAQEGARYTHAVHFVVEKIVDFLHDKPDQSCVLTWPTTHTSAMQQKRPGET